MKWWLLLASVIAALITAWLVLYAGVEPSTLVSLGVGGICLLWLLVILTVPWNLCFGARQVLYDIRISRELGIEVAQHREEEARRIARRMLALAITGHVASAAVITIVTYVSGASLGYWFAGFYLLATAFRPAGAYTSHLRDRIKALGREVRYPRLDVVELRDKVNDLDTFTDRLERDLKQLAEELAGARRGLELADHDLGRRLTLMTRRFDESLDGLSENEEVIRGLKAFVRLVKADQG
ncbi:hypothetical protein [Nonomuraea rhizosphaerae]|uniref:hypothetical protein n=1 Tax=Nonomuraea rhizosphaerae TaxID=2665663 RepID=UPI001C5F37AA|nr:hypothetical protein [Nonomuraea rhizosphaerae]